ncbi:helix-turn-helix domain-containing protein [Clostridium sp. WILCCON 0269]|uniref:Helix-turn-helix domain-containing protein n=1 Tax=Candidatus Clostridium eludens TaxID=3381663 RepID=A0ABW8SQG2_9CLOT
MSLSDNLKYIRKSKKLTQKELAAKSGITRESIGNYERGDRIPPVDVLNKIAKALNVSVNNLIKNSITIEMHENEHITPKGQELVDNLDLLNQTIANSGNIRIYYLAGDNTQLIIDLINRLLEDKIEAIDFFSSILGSNDFDKLRNKNYTMDDLKKDKTIEHISEDCSKMPICMARICIDLYNIISHTQNLASIAIEQRLGTTLSNGNKIIEKANLSNDEYKNLGEELIHLIQFKLFKEHKEAEKHFTEKIENYNVYLDILEGIVSKFINHVIHSFNYVELSEVQLKELSSKVVDLMKKNIEKELDKKNKI